MSVLLLFFFNDPSPTEIYTLSLHDALPISRKLQHIDLSSRRECHAARSAVPWQGSPLWPDDRDRKSTRLNSSHTVISYAVFCLKKKKINRFGQELERARLTDPPPAFIIAYS